VSKRSHILGLGTTCNLNSVLYRVAFEIIGLASDTYSVVWCTRSRVDMDIPVLVRRDISLADL